MTDTTLLHRLADLAGIQSGFHDIWGQYHPTSDEARRALLSGLGLPGDDDASLAVAIHELDTRPWYQTLPPVLVAPTGQPVHVLIHLPDQGLDQAHAWTLTLEQGGGSTVSFLPRALQFQASRELPDGWYHALELVLPPMDTPGYHRLTLRAPGEPEVDMPLILHPPQCHQPPAVAQGGRVWGLSVQLYGLRSRRNWGMGDFGDLPALLDWCAGAGAQALGLNPLHALFPHNPAHCSPYSPSSRQFLNTLYLDVEAAPEFADCPAARERVASADFQARLTALRAGSQVDYPAVAALKDEVLGLLYTHFRQHHLDAGTPRGQAFRAWRAAGGTDLQHFALYLALQAHFHAQDPDLWGWPVWPEEYRHPAGDAVAAFAEQHPDLIGRYLYRQWLADDQLAAAHRRAGELNLGLGLYADLAVGVDKGGAETWMHRDLYALDTRIGCPPDDFSPLGQDWGLPPWIPDRLREAAYLPFINMLRANMKHAGALRIDHVMGLMRLFWVPPALDARHGAYLAYPLADLLGILALESQRNRCLVVGEDLGTVPDEVRHALAGMGVLSYRLFYFERDAAGDFRPPDQYPHQCLVAASTHDLPTLAGWWRGEDLDLRTRLNLWANDDQRLAQVRARQDDRRRLLQALARQGLLPAGLGDDPGALPEAPVELVAAVHCYLARSPAMITLVQADDLLGETQQANLPGTVDQYPNWRRRLAIALEEWPAQPRAQALVSAMAERADGAPLPT